MEGAASEPTDKQAPGSDVRAVLEQLSTCMPFDAEGTRSARSKVLNRIAARANLIGLPLLAGVAIFAWFRYGIGSVGPSLDWLLLFFGLGVMPLLGVVSFVCIVTAEVLDFREMQERQGQNWASAYEKDASHAESLSKFPADALRLADAWFEQKIKRLERRQIRFFGGNDKLALLTLLAAGWASWKEIRSLLQGGEPPWFLLGLALLGGMLLGGLMLSRQWERMGYLRDLLAMAIKRKDAVAAE
jgi:hypothetical protein